MAKAPDHLYADDLRILLRTLGTTEAQNSLKEITEAEEAYKAAERAYSDILNAALARHYDDLCPLMRPCHRARERNRLRVQM